MTKQASREMRDALRNLNIFVGGHVDQAWAHIENGTPKDKAFAQFSTALAAHTTAGMAQIPNPHERYHYTMTARLHLQTTMLAFLLGEV